MSLHGHEIDPLADARQRKRDYEQRQQDRGLLRTDLYVPREDRDWFKREFGQIHRKDLFGTIKTRIEAARTPGFVFVKGRDPSWQKLACDLQAVLGGTRTINKKIVAELREVFMASSVLVDRGVERAETHRCPRCAGDLPDSGASRGHHP